MEELINSYKRQLAKLWRNLSVIEEREAEFFNEAAIPLDLQKSKRTIIGKIAGIEAQLAELEPEQIKGESVVVPFVIAAMTQQEASELLAETVFDSPEIAESRLTKFQEFKDVFQEPEVEGWLSHYAEKREDWTPRTCSEDTIRKIITDVVTDVNQLQRERLAPIYPLFRSVDFFAGNEDVQVETWQELIESGCVLVVDAISWFHPYIRRVLKQSEMGSKANIAMLVLSPVNPCIHEANQLLEQEIKERMKLAFVRFDKRWDELCEVGVGDLRAMKRWLFAILPEEAIIVQKQKPSSAKQRFVRKKMGDPTGIDRTIFGSGVRR